MITDLASTGPAGTWDGRELFQDKVHIDNNRCEHRIDQMSRGHLVATMCWLDRKAPAAFFQFGTTDDLDDLDFGGEAAARWMSQTPLYRALQAALEAVGGEQAMTPIERSARQPRRYMCTTASGAVYVVDLDAKTLQRLPPDNDPYPVPGRGLRNPVRLVTVRDMRVGSRALFQYDSPMEQPSPSTYSTDVIVAIHRTLFEDIDMEVTEW